MANAAKFDSINASMLDDGAVLIAGSPVEVDGVTVVVWPAGNIPTFEVDNLALGTLDPTVDPTGLSCKFSGIKGQAGVATVTMSGANPDGSPVVGVAVITITLDPKELDAASFKMTVTPA